MNCTQTTILTQLDNDRRWLHSHPEEGWTEFETTHYIYQRLEALGYECTVGKTLVHPDHVLGRNASKVEAAIERAQNRGVPADFITKLEGVTGVIAELRTGRPGPVTVCRFDIDCVCVEESQDACHIPTKEGFASQNPGLMHACGHDSHTAVGLAVAAWLKAHQDTLHGTIRLIFQPAEEGTRGALAMTEAGWVDDANYFIASHVGGPAKLGEVFIMTGGMLATSKIDIEFKGIASHAGADPEKGRSALLAAAATALMVYGISRHSHGDSRVCVGTLYAGEGRNVTPVHASLQVETRGTAMDVNDYLETSVRRIVHGIAETYGVESKVTLVGKAQTLPFCPHLVALAEQTARSIPNIKKVAQDNRPTASEDCTNFMRRVVDHGGECVQFLFGANHHGHHRPDFDLEPEAMLYGYEMFTRMILQLNTPH